MNRTPHRSTATLAFAAVVSLASLAGCGSMKRDMQSLCDAPNQVPHTTAASDPGTAIQDMSRMIQWAVDHGHSNEFRQFLSGLAGTDPARRPAIIRAEARKHGIESCPFADFLEHVDGTTHPAAP